MPLFMVLLTILYRRELKEAWPKPLIALSIVVVFAIPQVVFALRHLAETQAQYHNLSLFNPEAICTGCNSEQKKLATQAAFAAAIQKSGDVQLASNARLPGKQPDRPQGKGAGLQV